MKLSDLVKARRTIHSFEPNSLPAASLIEEAIASACWAPNHYLTEPWRFYLLGRETISDICTLTKKRLIETQGIEAAEKKTKRWLNIPGWLVVSCQKSDDLLRYQEDYAACSCAVQNFMLILWQQGIGTKWSTGAITRDSEFYDLVWIDQDMETIIGLVWYGYPSEIPETTRKPVQQVITVLP